MPAASHPAADEQKQLEQEGQLQPLASPQWMALNDGQNRLNFALPRPNPSLMKDHRGEALAVAGNKPFPPGSPLCLNRERSATPNRRRGDQDPHPASASNPPALHINFLLLCFVERY
jgi:hypothetical protein